MHILRHYFRLRPIYHDITPYKFWSFAKKSHEFQIDISLAAVFSKKVGKRIRFFCMNLRIIERKVHALFSFSYNWCIENFLYLMYYFKWQTRINSTIMYVQISCMRIQISSITIEFNDLLIYLFSSVGVCIESR